jgi:hypothetical protein
VGRPRRSTIFIKHRENTADAHTTSRSYQVPLVGQSPRLLELKAVHLCVNSPLELRSIENVSFVAVASAVTV